MTTLLFRRAVRTCFASFCKFRAMALRDTKSYPLPSSAMPRASSSRATLNGTDPVKEPRRAFQKGRRCGTRRLWHHGPVDARTLRARSVTATVVVLASLVASTQAPGCGSSGSDGLGGAGATASDGGTQQAGGAGGGGGPADAGAQDAEDAATCPEAAGTLTLYVIPPPSSLDWTTPNTMFSSVAQSTLVGQAMVLAGHAVSGMPEGNPPGASHTASIVLGLPELHRWLTFLAGTHTNLAQRSIRLWAQTVA